MTKKIFFGNYKGGVAKTTSVFELGAILAEVHQKKVLLVDLDQQCSLSRMCSNINDKQLSDYDVNNTLNYALEIYGEIYAKSSRLDILTGNVGVNNINISNCINRIDKFSLNGGELDFIPTVLDMINARINDISKREKVQQMVDKF